VKKRFFEKSIDENLFLIHYSLMSNAHTDNGANAMTNNTITTTPYGRDIPVTVNLDSETQLGSYKFVYRATPADGRTQWWTAGETGLPRHSNGKLVR
jgi:hypothetical protein